MTEKRSIWARPRTLFAIGMALVFSGLGWGTITGVGIPYQDPTPAMQAYEDRHMMIVDWLMGGGIFCLIVTAVWSGVRLIGRAHRRWKRSN